MGRYISTGDGVVDYGAVNLFLVRCGRLWHCRSLLGTVWYVMSLQISTGDVMVEMGPYIATGDGVVD